MTDPASASPKSPPAPRKPLSAGQEVDAWCTRCKLDLGHRIVAMVAGVPKRVLCMTCGSEHNYRAPADAKGARPTRSRAGAPKKTAGAPSKARSPTAARARWEAAIRSGKPILAYSTSTKYEVGQLVSHARFGMGYVADVVSPTKIIIAFETGERTLLQGS